MPFDGNPLSVVYCWICALITGWAGTGGVLIRKQAIRTRSFGIRIYNNQVTASGSIIHIVKRGQFHQFLDIARRCFFKDAVLDGGDGVHLQVEGVGNLFGADALECVMEYFQFPWRQGGKGIIVVLDIVAANRFFVVQEFLQ